MGNEDRQLACWCRRGLAVALVAATGLLGRGVARGEEAAVAPRAPALVLAKALPEDGVILSLKKGEYDQALADVTPRLEKPQENLALRLYERGLVQFHMGVAKGDAGLVADAGLSFMRVVIYFGRAGAVSPFYGPALVGAGQVFEQLGRRELAIALYRQSRDVLTSDDDSALAALRDERLKALEAGTEKPPTP